MNSENLVNQTRRYRTYKEFLYDLTERKMNMESENRNTKAALPYSYHTFMYPFSYDAGKDEGELQIDGQRWEEEADPKKGKVCCESGKDVPEKDLLIYNEYQYFFPQARRYIFNSNEKNEKSEHALYRMKGIGDSQNGGFYCIKVTEQTVRKEYVLSLKNIRLSVYPRLKIGILLFETEYYSVSRECAFADALAINDLGRRLFAPCITYDKDRGLRSILTADEIRIYPIWNECARKYCEYSISFQSGPYENEQKMKFVGQILGLPESPENPTKIKSILDERMFTACLVRDNALANTPFVKHLHKSMEDWEKEGEGIRDIQKLYEFIFMDKKGDCTCQSRRMLERLLKNHIYDRWAGYGTFHGITEYSFVCATGEDTSLKGSVINPFLTIYVDMAKMALAQRAALAKIEGGIRKIPQGGVTEDTEVEAIRKNREQYLLCQCKLCLTEVTFQQQGTEIYRMLKEAFGIHDMMEKLEEKMDNLHNIAELYYQQKEQKADQEMNGLINLITFVGLPLAVFSAVQDFWFGSIVSEKNVTQDIAVVAGYTGALLSLVLLLFLLFRLRKYLKKKK